MKRSAVDGADWVTVLGVVLLAAALWLWLGWAALLGFVGAMLIMVGVALAARGAARR